MNKLKNKCEPYIRATRNYIPKASTPNSAEQRAANELFQRQVEAAKNVMKKVGDKKKAEN